MKRLTWLLPIYAGILAHSQGQSTYPYAISTIAGAYQVGNGGPSISALLDLPQAVAIDKSGNILIADGVNHGIRKITSDGMINSFSPIGAADLKLDSAGNIYVVDGVGAAGKISTSGALT